MGPLGRGRLKVGDWILTPSASPGQIGRQGRGLAAGSLVCNPGGLEVDRDAHSEKHMKAVHQHLPRPGFCGGATLAGGWRGQGPSGTHSAPGAAVPALESKEGAG